jgi:hypothetical protein
MALSGARNQHYRTLSYSVVSAVLGTHNPLVPGSNPGGPNPQRFTRNSGKKKAPQNTHKLHILNSVVT